MCGIKYSNSRVIGCRFTKAINCGKRSSIDTVAESRRPSNVSNQAASVAGNQTPSNASSQEGNRIDVFFTAVSFHRNEIIMLGQWHQVKEVQQLDQEVTWVLQRNFC